ncbi:MAG TPA: type II toxin-antitoxin system VapC family toxin [Terriglobales bacterium]|nr:type II toxin-antitoxin system VapC family toxin [Terriglobales bacterium]
MIVDSSALVSILLQEPGYEILFEKLNRTDPIFVSAPIAFEAAIVLSRRLGRDARPNLAGFLSRIKAEIVDFTQQHYEAAVAAYLRFGKGRHPAALNFGDCMSYALASESGLPLLYTGDDFSRTDILSA